MNNDDLVVCDEHGEGRSTYICLHLVEGKNDHWYSSPPEEEDDYPDAWCSICHEHFLTEGEWNERSEALADIENQIVVVCHCCYDEIKSDCDVTYMDPD